jgi:bacillithiol system protein YtxJ
MFKNLFKSNTSDSKTTGIPWQELTQADMLREVIETSQNQKVLLFKHSTRCSISASALNRLERTWNQEEMTHIKPYFLDLIQYRNISSQIAQEFGVEHQSPQVIIISEGKAIYDNSHMGIDYTEIKEVSSK